MKTKFRELILVASLGCLAGGLYATSVRTVNLGEMVGYADRVFYGRCLEAAPAESKAGFAVVEYTFEVLEGIKGTAGSETVTFRQVQSGGKGQMGIPGMPAYRPGQKLVLFLHGDSELGLTSPVGFMQGVFQVRHDGDALKVVNGLGNQNLGHGLSLAQGRELGLSSKQFREIERGGAVRFDTLASAVRKIERAQDNQRKSIR